MTATEKMLLRRIEELEREIVELKVKQRVEVHHYHHSPWPALSLMPGTTPVGPQYPWYTTCGVGQHVERTS